MNMRRFIGTAILLVSLLSCSVPASVQRYTVTVGRERLEFVPQPERGYVLRTREASGKRQEARQSDAAAVPLTLPKHAKPIGGLDWLGVYTVENNSPASANEKTIAELRKQGQVAYIAPLFSSSGETVAIIPEIVVRVKAGTEMEPLKALCEKAGCTIKKRMAVNKCRLGKL